MYVLWLFVQKTASGAAVSSSSTVTTTTAAAATATAAASAADAAVVDNIPQVAARVVDTVSGKPAAGMAVKLLTENQSGTWSHVTSW